MGNKGEFLLSHYPGSKSLTYLCDLTSLSIDQINFIACQFAALLLSFTLKKYIRDPQTRLIYCMVVGIIFCNFCFGVQTFHVIISAGLSYLVIRNSSSVYMPWYVFTVSMLYLSGLHLKRQFESNSYSLDITGPMMVLTQKVTSLAFAVSDGRKERAKQEITELQKKHVISAIPDSLEFWSFIFLFQSMLAGPLIFFKQYQQFIYLDESPSSVWVVLKKLGGSIFFALLYLKVAPHYEIDYLKEAYFIENTSFLYKVWYIHLATFFERTKYYHAWILSDAVCNASGLGYDNESKAWNLVTNVHALKFEMGQNFKTGLDVWNIGTMRWLRYVVYERCSTKIRTLATYMASAVWHGFYPGYYLAFIGGALFTSSARVVRKTVRPLFLDNPVAKCCYDFSTWFTTRLVVAYLSFTFVLLDFVPSIIIYMKLYFFLHIASIGAAAILPRVAKGFDKRRHNTSSSTNNASLNGKKSVAINDIAQTYSTSADCGDQKVNTEGIQKLKTG